MVKPAAETIIGKRKRTFANNVAKLLKHHNLTRRAAATAWGINYNILNRWSSAGIAYVHPRNKAEILQLVNVFGFSDETKLWISWEPDRELDTDEVFQKLKTALAEVRIMIDALIWNREEIHFDLMAMLDLLHADRELKSKFIERYRGEFREFERREREWFEFQNSRPDN